MTSPACTFWPTFTVTFATVPATWNASSVRATGDTVPVADRVWTTAASRTSAVR